MAFIEESVWDAYIGRKKQDTAPTPDAAWRQAAQSFNPTGMDGPAPETPDWQQQLAEQMARRGPTPSTSSLSPSGLAGGTATSTVPSVSPNPEPFGWQGQLAEQMARRGPTPPVTNSNPLPSAADRARLFAESAQEGFQRPPARPVFPPTGMDGPPAPVPNPLEWFGQLNESARQRVPGYAGLADVTGEQVIPAIDKAMVRTLMNAGDVANPLSPRFGARWTDPAEYERQAEAAYQANPAPTALIPEGPARGVAGAMGELLHRSAQKAAPGLLGSASRIPATAEDWQRWSTEQSNPLVDVAVQSLNPAYNLGPGEVIRAAKVAGNVARAAKAPIRQAASAVGEALPDVRQALTSGEAGAVDLPRVGEAADTRRFYHGTGSAFETPEPVKFDPNGLKGPGYYLTDEVRVAGGYAQNGMPDAAALIPEYSKWVDTIQSQLATVQRGSPEEQRLLVSLDRAQGQLDKATKVMDEWNPTAGPNVRAVDIPRDLPLFDTTAANIEDAVLDTIDAALPDHQRVSFQVRINNIAQNNRGRITGDDVYDALADVTNSKANANATLERAGYAGLEYAGGRHMPLLDEQGRAIEHSAVVVFPAGLPKIKNAISGTIGGSPPEVGGAVVGAVAYQDDPNLTPEENLARRAAYAGGGAALGNLGRRLGGNSRLGGTVEDVGRPGTIRSTGKERAATGMTKQQEQYLTGKLEDVAPKLPEKIDKYAEGQYKVEGGRVSGGTTIHIPDDGSVTVHSQEQANALHYRVTGKPIEGMPRPKDVTKAAAGSPAGEPYRFNPYKEADEAMQYYGHPTRAADTLEKQLANLADAPETVRPTELQANRLQQIIAELRLRAEGRTTGNPNIKSSYRSADQPYNLEKEMARLAGGQDTSKGRWAMTNEQIDRSVPEATMEAGKKITKAMPTTSAPANVVDTFQARIQAATKPSEIYRLDSEIQSTAAIPPREEGVLRDALDRRLEELRVKASVGAQTVEPERPIWSMGQGEYIARRRQVARGHLDPNAESEARAEHYEEVKAALRAGEDVPQEVLDDYSLPRDFYKPTGEAPLSAAVPEVPPAQAIPADAAPVAKSRAQVAREEEEGRRAAPIEQLMQSTERAQQAQVAEQARITEIAREAADMPYEQLASNEDTMRGLLRWYYTKVGNIGMASRLRQGDTIPRVDLSRAQKLALERLRDTAPDPLAPASDIAPPAAAITESRPPAVAPQPSRWRPQQPVETVAPEQAAQEVAPVAPLEAAPVDAGIAPPSKPPVDLPPTPPEPPSLGLPLLPSSSLPSVKPTRDIIDAAYQPDAIRRLTDKFDNPITRSVAQAIGVAKRDVFTQGLVLRESILADWKSAVVGAMAKVRSRGDSAKLFNVDKDGMATIGTRKVALNDVLEYPDRFPLTAEQKRYAQTVHQLYDDQAAGLAAEGIDIKQLQFEPGGHYVGRKVYGRIDDATGDVEFATVRSGGPGRVGGKAGFEKGRSFDTQADALKAGFRYMTPEEALNINLNAAGKKIADKRLSDFILAQIPYRTAVAPEELKVARDYARDKLAAWGKAKLVINRGYRGERVPPATVASVGKFFPDVGQKMIEAGITKSEVVPLRAPLQEAEKLLAAGKLQAQRDFYKARDAISEAAKKAQSPQYGEGMVMTPAFQGKFFSEADAKRLREITDIEPHSPLRGTAEAASWINAPARIFMTTWDFGISLIQGQVTLFSRPGTWTKATGRSLQALVSNTGYQGFLNAHADTIKQWSQYGAMFTPSEFTEAIGRGGILEKVPVVTRIAKPFARQYESYLNALRIYGLESTEKLAKTEADKYGLAKFWNEMAGQVDTARMGISPTQRAVESALLFAPRYRRAVLSLMTDVARGGLRGKMARDAIAKATVAGLAGYMATWTVFNAIDPQGNPSPHLDPREGSRFLTVKWGSQNIGMGGAYYGTSRALLQMALEPEKTAEIALRYVSGLMSPVAGTAGEMGMPRLSWPEKGAIPQLNAPYVYSAGPKNIPLRLTKAVVGENLTPIWAQGWLLDNTGGGDALISTIVESTGGRAFPDRQPAAPATKSDSGYRGPGYSGSGSSAGYRGPGYSGAGR